MRQSADPPRHGKSQSTAVRAFDTCPQRKAFAGHPSRCSRDCMRQPSPSASSIGFSRSGQGTASVTRRLPRKAAKTSTSIPQYYKKCKTRRRLFRCRLQKCRHAIHPRPVRRQASLRHSCLRCLPFGLTQYHCFRHPGQTAAGNLKKAPSMPDNAPVKMQAPRTPHPVGSASECTARHAVSIFRPASFFVFCQSAPCIVPISARMLFFLLPFQKNYAIITETCQYFYWISGRNKRRFPSVRHPEIIMPVTEKDTDT